MNTARIRNILLSPKTEWQVIAEETPASRDLWVGWVLPLALIPAVAGLIGGMMLGGRLGGVLGIQFGTGFFVRAAVLGYVQSLVAVFLIATLARVLAPNFGAQCNGNTGLKLAAYSFTASWVAGLFALIPMLAPIAILGGLYSIYLLYLGVRPLTAVPDEKAVPYAGTLIVVGIVVMLAFGWILR
jgi:hypothetical protein